VVVYTCKINLLIKGEIKMVKINGKPVSKEEFKQYIKILLEIAKEKKSNE